jgi:hypothetical protein
VEAPGIEDGGRRPAKGHRSLSFVDQRAGTRVRVLSLGVAFRRWDSGSCLTKRSDQRAWRAEALSRRALRRRPC